MPSKVTNNRLRDFLDRLAVLGSSSSNRRLREELGWDEDFYWKVQGRLVESGQIVPGRGMGGTVRLTAAEAGVEPESETPSQQGMVKEALRERDLYAPLVSEIERTWIQRFGFDAVEVAETHSRGSKDTGGTFTRPDITAAGIRRYVYLPKTLEIITFEVKPKDSVNVLGVLEAIAHREAAHRAYVVYAVSEAELETSPEAERILSIAQKYGIGVLAAADPAAVETWEIALDAVRHDPDPARLDRFLGDLPSDAMKRQLSKWKE